MLRVIQDNDVNCSIQYSVMFLLLYHIIFNYLQIHVKCQAFFKASWINATNHTHGRMKIQLPSLNQDGRPLHLTTQRPTKPGNIELVTT